MNPSVTPELRQWIIEQATAGFPPESVVRAMQASGWPEDVAVKALESTLQDLLKERTAGKVLPGAPVAAQAAGAKAPDIDLSGSPRQIDLGDRVVEVLASFRLPRAVLLGGLLSDEECDGLIEAARPRMARSLTVQTQTGGEEVNPDRTSNGMFFNRGESDLMRRIEERIARLVRWPVENGEGIQVLNYKPGAEYRPHYDYFDPAEPGTPAILRRGGQRVGTVVMYLNNPVKGGGTTFPDAGIEVFPKKGNALFFAYARAMPDTMTLHGGAAVVEGEKWIATKWMRERRFD